MTDIRILDILGVANVQGLSRKRPSPAMIAFIKWDTSMHIRSMFVPLQWDAIVRLPGGLAGCVFGRV